MKYYLAVDIGASSGRLILGHRDAGKMILEEVHRFGNGMELLIPWLILWVLFMIHRMVLHVQ